MSITFLTEKFIYFENNNNNMITEIQPLVDIIALSLQSAFIKHEPNGVSLLIISEPETAKTTTIFNFSNLDFVQYYDEVTQKKLLDDFLPLVRNKEKRTLLIPDLINCIDKQKSTRNQFLNIIKSGIDDTGIVRVSTFHKHLDIKELAFLREMQGLKFNLITAITSPDFKTIHRKLKSTGLLSRFIPFSYKYPIDKIRKILDYIENENKVLGVTIPKINKKDTEIKGNPELFRELEIVSTKLGQEYGAYGFRAQKNLQRLCKANALINKRKEVTQEDIDKILELSKWINFKFNPL